jgi:hypothetical protein
MALIPANGETNIPEDERTVIKVPGA